MFTSKYKLDLNKTVATGKLDKKGKPEKERVQVGFAMVPYPTLADFGIQAEVSMKDGKPEIGKDGVPIYAKDEMDWLQQAIISQVSVECRNKFMATIKAQPDKVETPQELQPDAGKRLPVDFESLTAETKRSGEALAIRREALADFTAFLQANNRPVAVVAALGELFANSNKILGSASRKFVEALGQWTEKWTQQLDEAKTTRYTPKILELSENINNALEAEELDLS